MKNFLSNKGLGFYASALAVILSAISAICYGVCVENNYSLPLIFTIITAVLALLICVKNIKFTSYVPFITSALAFGFFFFRLLNNLADIMAKNDMDGISFLFIFAMVLSFLALICTAISVCAKHEKE